MADHDLNARVAELARRVEMLEKDNSRLRRRNRLGRLVSLAVGVAVVFGAVVAAAPDKDSTASKATVRTRLGTVVPFVPETPVPRGETGLRAQKIVIVNPQGKVGAVLQAKSTGGATLTIFDRQGNAIWSAPNPIPRAFPAE